jgi:hypothetical protein
MEAWRTWGQCEKQELHHVRSSPNVETAKLRNTLIRAVRAAFAVVNRFLGISIAGSESLPPIPSSSDRRQN